MTDAVTNELMYEILKQIRDDVRRLVNRSADHDEQFKGLRHMLMAMQSDDLRHEATIAGLRSDIDTIKNRLNLTDA